MKTHQVEIIYINNGRVHRLRYKFYIDTIKNDEDEKKSVNTEQDVCETFEAYNKDGIIIVFHFISHSAQEKGVCRIKAVIKNVNDFEIKDFEFMVAVSDYLKLQIKPADGTVLNGKGGNLITQELQLTNTLFREKEFSIKIKISYKIGDNKVVKDALQIELPSSCCNM